MPSPSVVLATAGYDHTVRFWEATSGSCYRTLQYADSVRRAANTHAPPSPAAPYSLVPGLRSRI